MSLSASLNAGVQGLAANSTRLSAISDNIVNANTNGYKRTLTEFSSVVIDGGNDTSYTAGGVKSYVKRDITAVSTLESTINSTDIAISGSGFIAITPSQDPSTFAPVADATYLTTTGSFQEDAEGYLVNSGDEYLLGWPLNADGTTVTAQPSRNSFTHLEPVNARLIKYNAVATSSISLSGPIPAQATNFGEDVQEVIHNEEYFDTIGNTHTLTYTFTPEIATVDGTSSNTWQLDVTDSATDTNGGLIGRFEIIFNGASEDNSGTILSIEQVETLTDTTGDGTPDTLVADAEGTYDAETGMISVSTASSTIETFIGIPNINNGITQTGSLNTANIRLDSKDGSGYGEYKGVQVDSDGVVSAYFTNDQTRPIYQLPIITVANPNAMLPVGNQAYSITPESGSLTLADSGDRLAGRVVGFALAKSAVDVAQELTHLIETQRAYSSNAKIIQTVDEMLQETTNLKR